MSGMSAYFIRRLMLVPITFFAITFMVYAILRVVPGGPIEQAETAMKMAAMRGDPRSFDLVILDPPSFTRSRKQVPQAKQGYRALHREALRLLRRGGMLATASCSHHVREETFLDVVVAASHEMGRRLRWVARGMQSPDHPVLPEVPETRYLKFALFQVLIEGHEG